MPASKHAASFVDLDKPLPSGPSRRGHRRAQREKRAAATASAPAPGRSGGVVKGYRVIVSGMAPSITEAQVRSVFSSAGRILHCQLGRDQRTKQLVGAAEVVYETQAQADKAVHTLNRVTIDGHVVAVQMRGLAFYTSPGGAQKSGAPKKEKSKKPAGKSAAGTTGAAGAAKG